MTNLLPTIVPKSDQLNADDLIGGPMTIKVTKVALSEEADQPIAVHFEGDNGKPYKPCKSMRRVMVNVWGSDGNAFAGQRMTLYRDERVTFGKDAVGGIRISHMSGIDRDVTMALTVTRASRKPYTVKPLPGGKPSSTRMAEAPNKPSADGGGQAGPQNPVSLFDRIVAFEKRITEAPSTTKLTAIWNASVGLRNDVDKADPDELDGKTVETLTAFWQARFDALDEERPA